MKQFKIALIDDHAFLLDLMEIFLSNSQYEIVLKLSEPKKIIDLDLNEYNIDFMLLDIDMPELSGYEVLRYLKKNYPKIKIIILSSINDSKIINLCVKNGANGYITKESVADELLNALTQVESNKLFLCPASWQAITLNQETDKISSLTMREIEILNLIVTEMTSAEIADKLFLSIRTVENHRAHIMTKLDVKNTAALIKLYYTSGFSKLFEETSKVE